MTDTLVAERIESNLTRLRLVRIREILDQVIESAEKGSKVILVFLTSFLKKKLHKKNNAGCKQL